MAMILILFLQLSAPFDGRPVSAEWRNTPIGHWHCPDGYIPGSSGSEIDGYKAVSPLIQKCHKVNSIEGRMWETNGFDWRGTERVHWTVELPGARTVHVQLPSGLLKVPGCSGNWTEPPLKETKEELVLRGSSQGKPLKLDCTGIIQREEK